MFFGCNLFQNFLIFLTTFDYPIEEDNYHHTTYLDCVYKINSQ